MACRHIRGKQDYRILRMIASVFMVLCICLFFGCQVFADNVTAASCETEPEYLIEKGPHFGNDSEQSVFRSRSFGNFVADAVYYFISHDTDPEMQEIGSNAHVVVLLPNRVIKSAFPAAYITKQNILESMDNTVSLAMAKLDADQLRQVLEDGVSEIVLDTQTEKIDRENSQPDNLLQVCGLHYQYDVSAPAGEKIMKVTLTASSRDIDGMDAEDQILVITTSNVIRQYAASTGIPVTLYDAVVGYLNDGIWMDADFSESRISVIGTVDNSIVSLFPRWIVILIPLFAAVLILAAFGKMRTQKEQHGKFRD